MSTKLTVIFYIVLCLEAGIVLTLLPWAQPFGLGDWGDNYFLLYAAQKTGLQGLQSTVSSGWVRGAVTGLGLINLAMAFWEIFNFRRTVQTLHAHANSPQKIVSTSQNKVNVTSATTAPVSTSHLPDFERRDDERNQTNER